MHFQPSSSAPHISARRCTEQKDSCICGASFVLVYGCLATLSDVACAGDDRDFASILSLPSLEGCKEAVHELGRSERAPSLHSMILRPEQSRQRLVHLLPFIRSVQAATRRRFQAGCNPSIKSVSLLTFSQASHSPAKKVLHAGVGRCHADPRTAMRFHYPHNADILTYTS